MELNIPLKYQKTKLGKLAHNVLAVNEGFLCPIRKMRSILRAQKTLAERKSHKGACADWDFS